MKFALFFTLFVLVYQKGNSQTTLFQQDFSAGGTPANYVDVANPGTTRFTDISATSSTNGATTVEIVNNELVFYRPAGASGQGLAGRTLDFAPVPTSLYIQFTFDASEDIIGGISASATSVAVFYIGANSGANRFGTNGSTPVLSETFSKLAFNFVKVGNAIQWQLRNIASSTNSGNFVGKHQITWVLNKTGGGITYVKPNGVSGLETLATDKWDAWVDGTRVFDENSAVNASVDLLRFKFIFDSGIGYVRLDNFLIRDVNGALPISTAEFKAVATNSTVNLTWKLAQQSATLFSIERSIDALTFTPIGSSQQPDNPEGQRTYNFTDHSPIAGINYYRLRQTNVDGSSEVSKIVAVEVLTSVPGLTVLDNPGGATSIVLHSNNLTNATYLLTTLTGQPIPCNKRETPDGQVTLLPQHPLPSGVYLVAASTNAIRLTRRVLVR